MRSVLVMLALASVGCTSSTSTIVTVESAPGVTVVELSLAVTLQAAGTNRSQALPGDGGAPQLPSRVLVLTPARADLLTATATAIDAQGRSLGATGQVSTIPHVRTSLTLVLGGDSDGGVAGDGGIDGFGNGDLSAPAIAYQGTKTATIPMSGASSVTVSMPATAPGDVLIAAVAMGSTGNPSPPTITAPAGWSVVRRLDHANDTTLVVYWHVAAMSEPASYTWMLNPAIEGVAWISCYSGVDPVAPIAAENGVDDGSAGPSYTTPTINTAVSNAMVVATFATHAGTTTTWTAPVGTAARVDVNNGTTRSGLSVDELFATPGSVALTATASSAQDYALTHILALKPAN